MNEKQKTEDFEVIREFTCICCPIGCHLKVGKGKDGFIVTGNKCPRGEKYAIAEMTAPERILTTVVKVEGGVYPVVSVKTVAPIPKGKIFEAMEALKKVVLKAPVKVGDVVVENIVGSGVDVVVTHDVL